MVRPNSPSGKRLHKSMSQHGALCLLNGGSFHQRPEVLVNCQLLGVDRLGKAMQKHRRGGNVLASPSELRGIISSVQDVALDLIGATPGAARRVTRVWRSVLRRACQRRWQLALPPLSQLFAVLLRISGGLRTRVPRGVSL